MTTLISRPFVTHHGCQNSSDSTSDSTGLTSFFPERKVGERLSLPVTVEGYSGSGYFCERQNNGAIERFFATTNNSKLTAAALGTRFKCVIESIDLIRGNIRCIHVKIFD